MTITKNLNRIQLVWLSDSLSKGSMAICQILSVLIDYCNTYNFLSDLGCLYFWYFISLYFAIDPSEAKEEGTEDETIIRCPHSFETIVELGSPSKRVTWPEPGYLSSGLATYIEKSHSPGAEFPVGVTWVNYTFEDQFNNVATCNFSITVLEGKSILFILVYSLSYELLARHIIVGNYDLGKYHRGTAKVS